MTDDEADKAEVLAFVAQSNSLRDLMEISSTLAKDSNDDIHFVINSCCEENCTSWHAAFRQGGDDETVLAIGTHPDPVIAVRRSIVDLLDFAVTFGSPDTVWH